MNDTPPLDDEMQTLLEKLDNDDPAPQAKTTDTSPPLTLTENTAREIEQLPTAESLQPADVRNMDALIPVETATTVAVPEQPPLVDLRQQFEQMNNITQEVIQGARADRQEAQDAINLCRTEIEKAINSSHNPSRMYVDNLIKALEVKTTINMTVVKILEANSKLLAATKAGVSVTTHNNINNLNAQGGATDSTLIDILSKPLSGEDED